MIELLVAVLVVGVGAVAFMTGMFVERSRSQRRAREAARAVVPEVTPSAGSSAALAPTLAGLVTRTGAELAEIAVRTGVDIGNRAIRDSLGTLSAWAQREKPDLRRVTGKDGTVTLVFTDIVDSTALNERMGDPAWLELLGRHDAVVRRCVRGGGGQVIKTAGDSFMVAFARADRAVDSAVAIQRELDSNDGDGAIRVRIGIHTGEAIARGRDLFGLTVATAARVAASARGGDILVTDEVRARLDGRIRFGRAATVRLKGISNPQRVSPVRWTEMPQR